MNSELVEAVSRIGKLDICRLEISKYGYLSIGFGDRVYHGNVKLRGDFYGEWEIGSFHKNWRAEDETGKIVAGSLLGGGENEEELKNMLRGLRVLSINNCNRDVVVGFSGNVTIRFRWMDDNNDELFHIFFPDGRVLYFGPKPEWLVESPRSRAE